MKMEGLANERLSRNQTAAAAPLKQPGAALLRAGQLTPVRQLAEERKLPAVKLGNYLLDCKRLGGEGIRLYTQKNPSICKFFFA